MWITNLVLKLLCIHPGSRSRTDKYKSHYNYGILLGMPQVTTKHTIAMSNNTTILDFRNKIGSPMYSACSETPRSPFFFNRNLNLNFFFFSNFNIFNKFKLSQYIV